MILTVRRFLLIGVLLSAGLSSPAIAQEVRYSWLDLSFMGQTADNVMGTLETPIVGQFVDVEADAGDGIRFRGSVGTWHNMYMFIDYTSTDIDVAAVVTNPAGEQFPAEDEFDLTTVEAGLGVRIPIGLGPATDLFAEVSYDSIDLDFGSFAGEDFDTNNKDVGGAIGVRALLSDNWEIRAYGRYTPHGQIDLSTAEWETDTVFGIGFGWQAVRGFSIVADYETGDFSHWSIGFRLDLDED